MRELFKTLAASSRCSRINNLLTACGLISFLLRVVTLQLGEGAAESAKRVPKTSRPTLVPIRPNVNNRRRSRLLFTCVCLPTPPHTQYMCGQLHPLLSKFDNYSASLGLVSTPTPASPQRFRRLSVLSSRVRLFGRSMRPQPPQDGSVE